MLLIIKNKFLYFTLKEVSVGFLLKYLNINTECIKYNTSNADIAENGMVVLLPHHWKGVRRYYRDLYLTIMIVVAFIALFQKYKIGGTDLKHVNKEW